MEKNQEYFVSKHQKLEKVLAKVESKLESFSKICNEEFHAKFDTFTEEEKTEWREKMEKWNWDGWNDMNQRLFSRLNENWSDYKSWHWDKFGFNVY